MGVARKTGALTRLALQTGTLTPSEGIKPLWTFNVKTRSEMPWLMTMVSFMLAHMTTIYMQSMLQMVNLCGNIPLTAELPQNPQSMKAISISVLKIIVFMQYLRRSGKVLWTYYTEGPIRSSPRIAEGHIFFGSDDGLFACCEFNDQPPRMARRNWITGQVITIHR